MYYFFCCFFIHLIMKDLERLLFIIKETGGNEAEFARTIGINPQNITQFKTGSRKVSSKVWVEIIKNYRQFNPIWVVSGEGDIYNNSIKPGTIIKGNKVIIPKDQVSEPDSEYNIHVMNLEIENDKLKDELIRCQEQLIQALKK